MSTDLNDPGIRFDSRVPVPVIESSTEPGVTERVSEGFNRLESGLKPESMVSPNATKETRSMAYGLWPRSNRGVHETNPPSVVMVEIIRSLRLRATDRCVFANERYFDASQRH
ncbi:MAG: hypothetical protein HN526_17505 [Gammaproteobacteria bacterium]|nr:hypothetical protein [Gammaproteobacteria bacterium]